MNNKYLLLISLGFILPNLIYADTYSNQQLINTYNQPFKRQGEIVINNESESEIVIYKINDTMYFTEHAFFIILDSTQVA